ncbi:hypothetical protein ACIPLR_19735 [Herbaspirillum huttiense]|jgi:hypothetical protein|nr:MULTISPECIES: hypothetical protein [Herbaspirillum]MBN9358347.1 hypothetical protein [Herbaspirillum huttiense]MBP1315226.1 hypothetical protein [Herbaspirillum sp. 1130]MCO4859270.1 hypothetical protein [Herbaspirillum sp. WGmk3]MCP3655865.1 hypothetical protein [Herbaspirillum sp.]MCP3948052.1 hypothetical protein [Herbaspirillum sp.]|tara:strand:+ start:479 stop:628 length:150 start_codon:yes stop_codon:yes gene_type:complete
MEHLLLDAMQLADGFIEAATTFLMACDISVPAASHEAHGRHFMTVLGMA